MRVTKCRDCGIESRWRSFSGATSDFWNRGHSTTCSGCGSTNVFDATPPGPVPAFSPEELLGLLVRDAAAAGRDDETVISFGWWEGAEFNPRMRVPLGEVRRGFEANWDRGPFTGPRGARTPTEILSVLVRDAKHSGLADKEQLWFGWWTGRDPIMRLRVTLADAKRGLEETALDPAGASIMERIRSRKELDALLTAPVTPSSGPVLPLDASVWETWNTWHSAHQGQLLPPDKRPGWHLVQALAIGGHNGLDGQGVPFGGDPGVIGIWARRREGDDAAG